MSLVEMIAKGTWNRIQDSRRYSVRLGEETLTDLLLLDFAREMSAQQFRLYAFTKQEESQCGADIEIIVNIGGTRAVTFTVQAKKLSGYGRYDSLNAKVSGTNQYQLDVLERYSRQIGAIPFYLLYNYAKMSHQSWHCCQKFDEKQLGCTLVPSWEIRRAIKKHGSRTFHAIHSRESALPWRCLFDCPYPGWRKLVHEAGRSLWQLSEQEVDDFQDYGWMDFEPRRAGGPKSSWSEDDELQGWRGADYGTEGTWPAWLWEREEPVLSSEDARLLMQKRQRMASVQVESGAVRDPFEPLHPRRLVLYRPQLDPNENDADRN